MGRRKIQIRPIQHERNRAVTFFKRKAGLFKKAYELSVLCSIDIGIIIFDKPNPNSKCYEYSSTSVTDIVNRHVRYDGEIDRKGTADFQAAANNGQTVDDDDDDNEDDYYKQYYNMSRPPTDQRAIPPPTHSSTAPYSSHPTAVHPPPTQHHPSLPAYAGEPSHSRTSPPVIPHKPSRRHEYRPYPDPSIRRAHGLSSGTYTSPSYGSPADTPPPPSTYASHDSLHHVGMHHNKRTASYDPLQHASYAGIHNGSGSHALHSDYPSSYMTPSDMHQPLPGAPLHHATHSMLWSAETASPGHSPPLSTLHVGPATSSVGGSSPEMLPDASWAGLNVFSDGSSSGGSPDWNAKRREPLLEAEHPPLPLISPSVETSG